MKGEWKRVSKFKPCQICGKADWCLIAEDGGAAICPRVESDRRVGEAGYLHRLKEVQARQRRSMRISIRAEQPRDLTRLSGELQAEAERWGQVEVLSRQLQVSAESLRRLGVGWCARESCWTFSLSDEQGRVVGLNRRFADGRKRIMRGHQAGLYLPIDLPVNMAGITLHITEGGSDTATALALGFWAVGRFSCTHGAGLLRSLIKARRPDQVIIIADRDEPGQDGAERLAERLVAYVPLLKIMMPAAKDLRAWRMAGADRMALHREIETTPAVKLVLT
jgi:hypothetical protein